MGLHYGTQVRRYHSLEAAGEAAIARHSHYYTEAAGWLLRAEAVRYAAIQPYADPVSGDGEWYTTAHTIELFAFPVVRWTPFGATIQPIWGHRTRNWVGLRDPDKQWASRTAEQAVRQLMLRRRRQRYILERQMDRARAEESLAFHSLTQQSAPLPELQK